MHSDGFTGWISDEVLKSILSETQSTVKDTVQHTEIRNAKIIQTEKRSE